MHVALAIFLIRDYVTSAAPLLPVGSPATAGLGIRVVSDA
jgi:hypothetical protein